MDEESGTLAAEPGRDCVKDAEEYFVPIIGEGMPAIRDGHTDVLIKMDFSKLSKLALEQIDQQLDEQGENRFMAVQLVEWREDKDGARRYQAISVALPFQVE